MNKGKKFTKLKLKILYVEDEDVVRGTVTEMLRRRVGTLIVAANGQEGLDKYFQHKPDLILSDIKMPVMDGLSMVRKIREDNPDIPVVITSAYSDSDYLLRAIDAGVDKFALKPVNNRDLFNVIKKEYDRISSQLRFREEERQRLVAQRNLRESQEQIRALFDNVVVGMGIIDTDLSFIFANQTLGELVQEDEISILGHSLQEYLEEDSEVLERMQRMAGKIAADHPGQFRTEERVHTPGGMEFWAEISISVIIGTDNIINKFVIVLNNVDSRIKTQQERDSLYNSLLSELETAASVQSFFLPDWLCIEDQLLFSNNYTPSTNVGGDLFDLIRLPGNKYLVYMGDISGHGVQSALIMTAVKSTIKMLVENSAQNVKPHLILNQINELMSRDVFQNNYLTLLLGVVDINTSVFRFCNAGHPPIIRYSKKNMEVELIESSGAIPIGWLEDYKYSQNEEDEIILSNQSSYILYTDGIFECENDKAQEMGIDGILALLNKLDTSQSTLMLPYVLKKAIVDNHYDISSDDFTILTFNLRRDLNDRIRYYMFNPQKDNPGEIGRRCEEFLKAENLDSLAFPAELLVNEFLNKILKLPGGKTIDEIIVIRIRILTHKLEITFWDKGEPWELPNETCEKDFILDPESDSGSLFIVRNISDQIIRKNLQEVNETIFYLNYKSQENKVD